MDLEIGNQAQPELAPNQQDLEQDLEIDNQTQPQSAPNQQSNDHIFADSSGPFFTLYSEAAEDEDNKMVKSWQEDAEGILIFTGLFSAAVAALLTVTFQDLRPNSQDTSAFYLGNIYEVLADPNVTRTTPVAKPPPFSRPRYAIWANSLLFLSLVMSLSCALLATSLQQWARRYIRLTQLARARPEKRARMREFYHNGVDKMHIPWAVEGLPTLLHLSLFLFFCGLAVFLFNVDQEVFICVACWIGLFLIVYGLITLLPLIRRDSPYYTPLSKPAWFLYSSISFLVRYVIASAYAYVFLSKHERRWLKWNYLVHQFFQGIEKEAEETAEEQSSEIDVRILDWTISALGDDDSQEKFFESIPGLFNSSLVRDLERKIPNTLLFTFWKTLDKFIRHTTHSNSVSKEVVSRRVDIAIKIKSIIPCTFISPLDWVPVNSDPNHLRPELMTRWFYNESPFVSCAARVEAADNLARMRNCDDPWIELASKVSGISEDELRLDLAHARDNLLLATMMDTCRRTFHLPDYNEMRGFIESSGHWQFNICDTLPRLQHEFCKLWNEILLEARKPKTHLSPARILIEIRQHFISLHQGTDSTPPPATSGYFGYRGKHAKQRPKSYPLCVDPSHPPQTSRSPFEISFHLPNLPLPTQSGDSPRTDAPPPTQHSTVSRQVEEIDIAGSSSRPHPTTPIIIRDNSQAPAATDSEPTLQVHTSSHPSDASTPGAALQGIPPVTILSLEGPKQRDTVLAAGAAFASASNSFSPALSAAGFAIPTVPSPSHVPPFPDVEFLSLLSSTKHPHPTANITLPRSRARGLVNTGGMCFSNSMLQLLVHSPPCWDVFRKLEDMKGQLGAGGPEIATPLVDATVMFFEEFLFKEKKLPPTQQPPQQAVRENLREDEEEKKEHNTVDSFEPTYMYDAMKEKTQLKDFLDGNNKDAKEFLRLFLDALDKELVELQTYISMHEPASAPSVEVLEGEGQTEVKERDCMASPVTSMSRIFGGRSRKTVRVPNQPNTVTIEAWQSLQLNIQPDSVHTIQDALLRVSQPRSMQVVQSSSTSTSTSNEATQEVLLGTLPQTLVLHLERFMYNAATESINTIRKPIQFGPELEIPLEIMVPAAGKSTMPMHYKLYGVLYHHGEPTGTGHYTVDVLHQNGDNSDGEAWLHIDDETVSAVRHEDVFGGQENERMDNGCVYMLFYFRTAPTQA